MTPVLPSKYAAMKKGGISMCTSAVEEMKRVYMWRHFGETACDFSTALIVVKL
jgi:hypothetical protein